MIRKGRASVSALYRHRKMQRAAQPLNRHQRRHPRSAQDLPSVPFAQAGPCVDLEVCEVELLDARPEHRNPIRRCQDQPVTHRGPQLISSDFLAADGFSGIVFAKNLILPADNTAE
jgi:hypothetical protein